MFSCPKLCKKPEDALFPLLQAIMSYLKVKLKLKLQLLGHLVVKFHSNLIIFLVYKQMMLAEHHVCMCDTPDYPQTPKSLILNISKQT